MKDSEIIWAARERIAKGWIKGAASGSGGRVCADAAIFTAPGLIMSQYPQIIEHLQSTLNGVNLIVYNDAPSTTHEDILSVFEKTALRLEEQAL